MGNGVVGEAVSSPTFAEMGAVGAKVARLLSS